MENDNTLFATLLKGNCQQSKTAIEALLVITLPIVTNGLKGCKHP